MAILTAISAGFMVTRPLALAFRAAPVVVEGEPFAVEVEIRDGDTGDLVDTESRPVMLSVAAGPGSLVGDTSVPAVAGVAAFSDLMVTSAGVYTLRATAMDAAPALSESIDASPGMVAILALLLPDGRLALFFALPIDPSFAGTLDPPRYSVAGADGPAAIASVTITGLRSLALRFAGEPPEGTCTVGIAAGAVRSTTGALAAETELTFEGVAPPPSPPEPPPPVVPTEARYGAESYARQLQQLLPRGAAWLAERGSVLARSLLAIGDELARIDSRANELVRESDPRSAVETLPDWERMLGLPDETSGELAAPVEGRQAMVTQRYVSRGGQSRAFFIAMAGALGFEGATVEEHLGAGLRVGFRAGDRCTGDAWPHVWTLHLPSGPADLRPVLESVVRRSAPAHTTVLFSYT